MSRQQQQQAAAAVASAAAVAAASLNLTGSATSATTANASTTENANSSAHDTNEIASNASVTTNQTHRAASSDDETNMEEYENAIMMIDNDATTTTATQPHQTNKSDSKLSPSEPTTSTTVPLPTTAQQQQLQPQLECIPLLDYITNIMKFVEAILSNNSTDDHCKEFVKQKGLVPLLQILSLPNLPIDFPNSAACQSVAQVCKAILHLAREPQVIDQALNCLAEALSKCETLYYSYINSSGTTK
jgi:hypothetical protein